MRLGAGGIRDRVLYIASCMKIPPKLALLSSDAQATMSGVLARCEAANFRWEVGVSGARGQEYESFLELEPSSAHKDWQAEHKGYVREFVQVPQSHPRSAETFMAVNADAHLLEQMDNAVLIRLESLASVVNQDLLATAIGRYFWDRFYNYPKDLAKEKLSADDEALRGQFMDYWHAQRLQARPLFATFLSDFGGNLSELIKQDWPHLLRDRLGLTHWPSDVSAPLPVALMCYSVDEVRQARAESRRKGAVCSFARPTVLDTEMSAAFVPAPCFEGGESFGHTLDLAQTQVPPSFTPELLTFPLRYQARHLKALGFISRPHALQQADGGLDEAALFAARNRHVQGLQSSPDCADFAEVLA